ncbi:type VII secretion integral membrane protein EccD [Micromonospora echinofusca]|uniref:Type VII secretion integral membrane protein EccD n=1 Tax=Micromonospora echinofusca TaxID=47858 RepID=A0ABS3VRZ0_MICEH|nr:type VII secretion integral membrane protein EccD [Micromonospora echinofusca]MBO4207312.1 type VII secretion integral membrane protein EccD [Micromonospora echinofusca]
MSASPPSDLCRVVVVTPVRSAELAVPANVALADLVPPLVAHLHRDGTDDDWASGGVVVQRLGEDPLDEDRTPAALGLRDGDTLYLRPRAVPMPALAYDDLIDGVATRLRERAGRWSSTTTRRLLLGVALATLALGLAVVLLAGPVFWRAVTAGLVSVGLLAAALAAARSFGDRGAAFVLSAASVGYGAAGGLLALVAVAGPDIGPAHVLATAATATALTVLAGVATGEARPMVLGLGMLGLAAVLAGLLATLTPLTPVQTAAIVATLTLLLSSIIPSLAFWLAGLRLPDLPATAEEISQDTPGMAEEVLTRRTHRAEDYVTALYVAAGLISGAALTWLTATRGWAPVALAVAMCGLLALRFRMLTHIGQRLAVLVPAVYGAGLLVLRVARTVSPSLRLSLVVTALLLAGCGALAAARVLPRRRVRPHWGRAAELLESLTGAMLVPLLLAVLGIFGLVRGLGG